jgi:hypothetical protein
MMEKWNEYTKCVAQPVSDLVELNMRTLNHWINDSKNFTDILREKTPVDFFTAQTKLMNEDIWFKSISQATKIFKDAIEDTTAKTSDMIQYPWPTKNTKR